MTQERSAAQRRGRVILLTLLSIGLFSAVAAIWPLFTTNDPSKPTVAESTTPSAVPQASQTTMSAAEAREEYYRVKPRATGWWQWVLIGGLMLLLVVIATILLTSPPSARRRAKALEQDAER